MRKQNHKDRGHANNGARKLAASTKSEAVKVSVPHEFKLGVFVVRVSNKQHYKLYTIYTPISATPIGKQASYPSEGNCDDALRNAADLGIIKRSEWNDILRMQARLRTNRA